ncbi:MAG: hypothetical protein ABI053_04605 [Lacisediminihabitans sp.]
MSIRNVTLVILAAALVLTGCTTQGLDYSAQTARPLQEQVLAVTESSLAGDPTASLTRLDELAASIKDARARGTMSAERYASIAASIALVRTDLEAAIVLQKQQTADNQKDGGDKKDSGDKKGKKD